MGGQTLEEMRKAEKLDQMFRKSEKKTMQAARNKNFWKNIVGKKRKRGKR